jgi:H+/Cl- antiporter ClcA
VIARILFAGVLISIVGYFFPEVLFAGETQIFPMIANPAQYGVAMLLWLGLLKLVMLALAFKSGFIGGPTFPILFACTMFGMALTLIFPDVPASIFVLCIEAAAISVVLRAPFTAILLVAVVGTADAYTIGLLILSSIVAMAIGIAAQKLMAQRAAQRQAVTTPT